MAKIFKGSNLPVDTPEISNSGLCDVVESVLEIVVEIALHTWHMKTFSLQQIEVVNETKSSLCAVVLAMQ